MSERRRRHPLLFSQFESVFPDADGSWLATLPDPDPLLEDLVEQHETQSPLFQAIQALPAKQRAAIWLRYMERLRYFHRSMGLSRRLGQRLWGESHFGLILFWFPVLARAIGVPRLRGRWQRGSGVSAYLLACEHS